MQKGFPMVRRTPFLSGLALVLAVGLHSPATALDIDEKIGDQLSRSFPDKGNGRYFELNSKGSLQYGSTKYELRGYSINCNMYALTITNNQGKTFVVSPASIYDAETMGCQMPFTIKRATYEGVAALKVEYLAFGGAFSSEYNTYIYGKNGALYYATASENRVIDEQNSTQVDYKWHTDRKVTSGKLRMTPIGSYKFE